MMRKLAFVIGMLLWIGAGSLQADDALLEQLYGNGVHDYNQGDYVGAYNALSGAIKGGTNDPRAYYFRGLADLRLGRDPEAKADFQAGAELEAGDSADVYPVDRSLERVQGSSRQILEQYRTMVHAAAIQRKEAERQARYEQRAAAEQDVLRRVPPTELPSSPAAPSSTNATSPATTTTPAEENPFSEPQPSSTPPAKKSNSAMPMPVDHGTNATVQPTPGGLRSLFRAVNSGLKDHETAPATPSTSVPVPAILQGLFGHGPAAPAGSAPNVKAAQPQPGGEGPPPSGDKDNPFGESSPPAATTPQTAAPGAAKTDGEMPATQPTTPAGTPQPTTPAQPKDSDNPFN